MDDQKHYVIVDNETYELYDGNGSFYVTKARHPADSYPLQKSFCPLREAHTNFLNSFPLPVPMTNSNVSSHTGQPLEPIIIDDYSNMNYFTQAASDVTIYLNSNNESNFTENANRQEGGYFVDSEGVIDLTKFSSNSQQTPNCSRIADAESTLDLNKTIHSITTHEELDAPEFIDISKLNLSFVNTKLPPQTEILLEKYIESNSSKSAADDPSKEDSEADDEVIFVKEFKANEDNDTNRPLDLRRKNEMRQKILPQPRRNPKRQVQLLKESFDLALKLSDEEIYCGRMKKPCRDCFMDNSKRSNTNTTTSSSPPVALTSRNYKEWPTEGLHERPVYNMATKKIEKFDFKCVEEKRKTPVKRNEPNATKPTIKGKKPGKKGKRKAPNRSKSAKRESPERGISKEFALLTHETLQEVMKYVSQVKEYNEIRSGNVKVAEPQADTGSLIDDANSLLDVVRSSAMEENLVEAVDLLTDSCVLYSLANDVCQASVAKYLKSVKGVK